MQHIRALGAKSLDPRVSGGWRRYPQTPSLWRLGASPSDPHWAEPPDPLNSPPPPFPISGYAPVQSLSAVNQKVVTGFENGFFYRSSITYWLLQSLGRILIKQIIGK